MQVLALQPGLRRWLYEAYAGHFWAAHLAVARYNIGNAHWHYKGWLAGIGVSYGYAWLLSKRWNLSVEAGVGLYYMKDRKRDHCVPWTADEYIGHNRRLVLGPSKCEVAFTYLF